MAFCVLLNGKSATLSREQGLAVWEVLNGRREPANEAQAEFVGNVKRLYLNRANAPQDYLDMYPEIPESYKSTMGVRK
jgi:hypothetical protein